MSVPAGKGLVGRELLKRFVGYGWHCGRVLHQASPSRYVVEWDDGERQTLACEQVHASLVALGEDASKILAKKTGARPDLVQMKTEACKRRRTSSPVPADGIVDDGLPVLQFGRVQHMGETLSSTAPWRSRRGHPDSQEIIELSRSKNTEPRSVASALIDKTDGVNSTECHICCEPFASMEPATTVYTMQCSHTFCAPCIERWFEEAMQNTCPVCRRRYAGLRKCRKTTASAASSRPDGQAEKATPSGRRHRERTVALEPEYSERQSSRPGASKASHHEPAYVGATSSSAKQKATPGETPEIHEIRWKGKAWYGYIRAPWEHGNTTSKYHVHYRGWSRKWDEFLSFDELRSRAPDYFAHESTACQQCLAVGDADAMLLCDQCDKGYHIHCLNPPLHAIPKGSWFCGECGNVAARQRVWRAEACKGPANTLCSSSHRKGLTWLQAQCRKNGLWAGGHMDDLCDRLARWELGMAQTPLEVAHSRFLPGVWLQMLFNDGLWHIGWVHGVHAQTVDIQFNEDEIEFAVPMVVDGAINSELRIIGQVEAEVDAAIEDIVASLEKRACTKDQALQTDEARDAIIWHHLKRCFANRHKLDGTHMEQWRRLRDFVTLSMISTSGLDGRS
eukprot:COSAG02_NODE_3081_length_7407_cov_6.572250_2_plen_621_part_00